MGFDKTKAMKLWEVTTQNSDTRMTTGDSASNTFTRRDNPLRGTLLWDRCMYVLHGVSVGVVGVSSGGSYTITIETDAVAGYTGLPIARASGIGPNSPRTIILDNLHQSPGSPLPTHINIDQTASATGIEFSCHAIAKQYRGVLGTAGSKTSERILQGTMIAGRSNTVDFSGDEGVSVDVTFAIGTSGSNLGMHRMRLWDHAFFWGVAGNSVAGTHDVDIIADVGGTTTSIASTGVGGSISAAGEKVALASNFFGQSPNPSAIIWTETTAGGVSDFRVVMMAKSGRGSLAKR